jgi:hypothetical protein
MLEQYQMLLYMTADLALEINMMYVLKAHLSKSGRSLSA